MIPWGPMGFVPASALLPAEYLRKDPVHADTKR